ncbi:MAG: 4'-phosphopantetheinyl transferase superfamily protein [Bacteroidales bacterium]|nr:4'-phosphopantetheinyl transferase superfamily protein [Bacteroidales bacterium]
MVEVFAHRLIETPDFIDKKDEYLTMLPAKAKQRVLQYTRAEDLQRSLFGELLVRRMISKKLNIHPREIEIVFSSKGKPMLKGKSDLHFNLSHSGHWVVCAIANKPVGIDVEMIQAGKLKIAKRFFTETEINDLRSKDDKKQLHYFFDLWTLKESYLKVLGKGLTLALNSFSVVNEENRFRIKIDTKFIDVHLKQYFIEEVYKLSVCAYEDQFADKLVHVHTKDLLF